MIKDKATLVEVGPRDGFQSVGPFIPTAAKIEIIDALYQAGVRRMEATSFVSEAALPQLADAAEIVSASSDWPELDMQVLVPNTRHAKRAIDAGAKHLSIVVSASERHNLGNIKRTPLESVDGFQEIVEMAPAGTRMRINIATAFDCPFIGAVDPEVVLDITGRMIAIAPDAEVALCDTTGRADPSQVAALFEQAMSRFSPERGWAFHAHDTYGLGAANALAAWNVGVRVFDASVAGLGGCPFAPGATGNVATEDLMWMFSRMGVLEGIDATRLLASAHSICELPGAQVGGRVRVAEQGRAKRRAAA
ncbi:hydroxymethylglutaryl-CoA lyase [Sphingobium sp.]|uniref:hydroxymethylglutaryl-CoA lyase n=1 Tax=Sphingobium sp. TaxID=1912891 RepID=UPI003BB58648